MQAWCLADDLGDAVQVNGVGAVVGRGGSDGDSAALTVGRTALTAPAMWGDGEGLVSHERNYLSVMFNCNLNFVSIC